MFAKVRAELGELGRQEATQRRQGPPAGVQASRRARVPDRGRPPTVCRVGAACDAKTIDIAGEGHVVNEKEKPLEGYKAIAAFLGKSERTTRYWAKDRWRGLPTYMLFGRVYAYPSKLRQWLDTTMVHTSVATKDSR